MIRKLPLYFVDKIPICSFTHLISSLPLEYHFNKTKYTHSYKNIFTNTTTNSPENKFNKINIVRPQFKFHHADINIKEVYDIETIIHYNNKYKLTEQIVIDASTTSIICNCCNITSYNLILDNVVDEKNIFYKNGCFNTDTCMNYVCSKKINCFNKNKCPDTFHNMYFEIYDEMIKFVSKK